MDKKQNIQFTQQQINNSAISVDKYRALKEFWAHGNVFATEEQIDYPDYFGGVYLNEEKNLVICLKEINDNIKDEFAKIISLDNVTFELVKYSYKELNEEKDRIVKTCMTNKDNPLHSVVSGVGLAFHLNSVNLYLDLDEQEAKIANKVEDIRRQITTFENIHVIFSPCVKPCTYVYPGTKLSSNISVRATAYFSVGFWATHDNDPGVVTAPHHTITAGDVLKVGKDNFGTALTPYCNNGGKVDAVFVKRTNSQFESSSYVIDWDQSITSATPFANVYGSVIDAAGATSGAIYGRIEDTNEDCKYDFGTGELTVIHDCVLTSAISQGGDSGGIVFGSVASVGNCIAGIIIASSTGGKMIYCKYENILSTLDITPII